MEICGHGLTSRPRESASVPFFDELLSLFRYPPKSGRALLNGTLLLRYCAARFAYSTPTWRLPASGHVDRLVAAHSDTAGDRGDEVLGLGVHRVRGSGPVRKRFRLNRKTPAHLVGLLIHSRPRVWKRLRHVGFQEVPCLITLGGAVIMLVERQLLLRTGLGWGKSPENCAGPRLQDCTPF